MATTSVSVEFQYKGSLKGVAGLLEDVAIYYKNLFNETSKVQTFYPQLMFELIFSVCL